MFATEGGRLYGGDSGSCFAGQFRQQGNGVIADLKMSRFNHDPNFTPMFPVDNAMLHFEGAPRGADIHFTGGTEALPGLVFTVVLTPINDTDAPPAGNVAADGIRNGLYSLRIDMLDGIGGGANGVMVLHEGRIRGGDAYFRLYRRLHCRRRQMEGRTRQSRTHAKPWRASAVRWPRSRHRLCRPATIAMARRPKQPRSPASAASASRRSCVNWWKRRARPVRSPATAHR